MKRRRIKQDELRDLINDSGFSNKDVSPHDLDFKDLMRFRVNNILLVSSRYDFYTLVDDGQLTEAIFSEYLELNLHYAPSITRVYSGEAALDALEESRFDLVITMMRLGDMRLRDFVAAVKQTYPELPVALLGYQSRELQVLLNQGAISEFDRVFIWSGDRKLFLAIIKLLEDLMNARTDCKDFGVRAILLVEDSPQFYSSFLPLIYTELIKQGQMLIEEGKNFAEKLLRQRARPKILHAANFEEAWRYFHKYRHELLGIITDIKFPINGVEDEYAGLKFIRRVREKSPELPVLVQSTREDLREEVAILDAAFANKNSRTLLQEVREFMLANFGFGDFIFRMPDGRELDRARTLRQLRQKLRSIPDESLRYHASHDHFSNWLMARTRFRLAQEIKPLKIHEFKTIEELRQYMIRKIDELVLYDERGMIADFSHEEVDSRSTFLRIGRGSLGGKARGLAFIDNILKNYLHPSYFPNVRIKIPRSIILCTEVFAQFMDRNELLPVVVRNISDEEIVAHFMEARFPESVEDDLRAIVLRNVQPLAVRSSSLLEDTLYQPFAGIYATVMLPNSNPDPEIRFRELEQAIKYVYASTYLRSAKNYIEATGHRLEEEQMGVIIQEMVGRKYDHYYYPHYSGVARSFNYYPFGDAQATDGIVNLALGLGKTIVDGGVSAQFCPVFPTIMPQFATRKDYFSNSQKKFYAVDLSASPLTQKPSEDENLAHLDVRVAEEHGTLDYAASTYCSEDDSLYEGTFRKGLRVLNFAPILQSEFIPLAKILRLLMHLCETAMNCPVEIEFAGTLGEHFDSISEFDFLQVRPMVKEEGTVDLDLERIPAEDRLLWSDMVLGNGVYRLRDIVYVNIEHFDAAKTQEMAADITAMNRTLVEQHTPYLLIGPGRWGSADPWLGIPVRFPGISGAHAVVETSLPNMLPDPSQGSHFFQNLTSFHIAYFTTRHFRDEHRIDWEWLDAQEVVEETHWVRHVRLAEPCEIRVDGQTGSGVVVKRASPK
ncbi:MAG TPA: PEP/pyruvate-binding domain-containing protein [Bacteroidota bacterium]|nr:PEP/pyruvate-binding domain-containing protein [Bacteroidota bacterium]